MQGHRRNMIFATEGPRAGRIVAVIDWEMAASVPLWSLVCYHAWFGQAGYFSKRDPAETQLFKDTYIRELQKYVHDSLILRIVQNVKAESRRRFADAAILPWDTADSMEKWLSENHR
jgi:aminoglycoside phosphotransferase (APT) family kinase protein